MGGASRFNGIRLIFEVGEPAPISLMLGLLGRLVCMRKKHLDVLVDALARRLCAFELA